MAYAQVWRNKFLTTDCEAIEQMAHSLEQAATLLREMAKAGVTLSPDGGVAEDYAMLVTDDPAVAKRFGMRKE
jgi:hypothetical protein